MLYMVICTINIPPMLAYIPYMDPMGYKHVFGKFLHFQTHPWSHRTCRCSSETLPPNQPPLEDNADVTMEHIYIYIYIYFLDDILILFCCLVGASQKCKSQLEPCSTQQDMKFAGTTSPSNSIQKRNSR